MACANEIISLKLHAAPNTPQPPALPTRGFPASLRLVSAVTPKKNIAQFSFRLYLR
jgi:hypothetical protein